LATIFLLLVAGERIANVVFLKGLQSSVTCLLPTFVFYWCCAVASPALLGRYPHFSYEYMYPLFIGLAGLLLSSKECDLSVVAARNATLLFVLLGLVLIPIKPSLVLESNYSQGLIPGLPRLAGLSPHAVQLGLVVQTALLCLWVVPLKWVWLNRSAWAMGMVVLFLDQSKTAWFSFALCAVVMHLVRNGPAVRKWVFDPARPAHGILIVMGFMAVALLAGYTLVFGHATSKVLSFLDTNEGATLLTLNGREQIWDVAFQAWQQNPLFGYGPTFLSFEHRLSLGMLNATHAHNQFFDDLARAGLVGAVALVVYTLVLLVQSVRYAAASDGLSIGLFLVIAIRGISEVPLTMYGYGAEFAAQLLLLLVLLGASKQALVKVNVKVKPPVGFDLQHTTTPTGARA
jgi:O-antigen ligase